MTKKKDIEAYSKGMVEVVQASLRPSDRLDANETAFLERQLTQLRTKTFDVLYGALKGTQFVPMATDIAPDVDTYAYQVFDKTGAARIGGSKDNDPPRVDVGGFEVTGKVYPVEVAYGWTVMEMRQSARLRIPLPEKKMSAARAAIGTAVDDMMLQGKPTGESSNISTTGIANASGVATHASDFTDWVGATDDDVVLSEIIDLITTQQDAVKENDLLLGDTLILPTARMNYIRGKRLGVDSTETVLSFLRRTYPEITFESWHRLKSFATGGTKDLAIFYARNPTVLEGVIPILYEELPPQMRNYETVVNCMGRCGGVKLYHPSGVRYRKFA